MKQDMSTPEQRADARKRFGWQCPQCGNHNWPNKPKCYFSGPPERRCGMTSELKAAAIVAIHGNDDAAFVELAPKPVKPMSEAEFVDRWCTLPSELASEYDTPIALQYAIDSARFQLAKRYADSKRGM